MSGYETALPQWRSGERRLAQTPAPERIAMDRVVEKLVAELRRRLGGPFSVEELVELYDRGTSWCLAVAHQTAPDAPWAWDERTVADAAFARYLREARDYAGGRRVEAG